MGSGQVQIPLVQTSNDSLNQVQQNTNKVFRNFNNQVTDNTTAVNQMTIVGEIKLASLTLEQFQAVAGTNWILANGQSSVGTKYAALTKNNTVPTITVTNATSFIRVN